MINKVSNLFANVKTHICSINIQFYQKATVFSLSPGDLPFFKVNLTCKSNLVNFLDR